VVWLVRNGFLAGLSLTTLVTTSRMRPYEVSLTREPARPHCYILYSSAELDKVRSYMRKIQTGDIHDYSATLRRPYRIMAASATQMEMDLKSAADTPAEPPAPAAKPELDLSGESIMAAISAHPDVAQRELLMASIDMMTKRATEQKERADAEAAQVVELQKQVEASEKSGRLNTAFLGSTLKQFRSDLPDDVADALDPELQEQAMTTTDPDVVRAAWSQHMITASMTKMLQRKAALEQPSNDRKRKAEEPARESDKVRDTTHERMAAINQLITGSASTMPTATPATSGSTAKLTPEEMRTAASMKLAAAFDSFRPLV